MIQPEDISIFCSEMEKQMAAADKESDKSIKRQTREAVLRNMYVESAKVLDLTRCLMVELEKVLSKDAGTIDEMSSDLVDDALAATWQLGTYLATYDEKDYVDADDNEEEEEEEEEEKEEEHQHDQQQGTHEHE